VLEEGKTLSPPDALPPPLSILHEDGWLVAVDKPAGLASQPPQRRAPGELTATNAPGPARGPGWPEGGPAALPPPRSPHDRGAGLRPPARGARELTKTWSSGSAQKRYLALVRGDLGRAPGRSRGDRPDPLVPGRFRVSRRGKPARTEVRRLVCRGRAFPARGQAAVGTDHQVRVHLAQAGCPVAGDAPLRWRRGVPARSCTHGASPSHTRAPASHCGSRPRCRRTWGRFSRPRLRRRDAFRTVSGQQG